MTVYSPTTVYPQALEEFGIKEYNDFVRSGDQGPEPPKLEEVRGTIVEEAHHGALRIAGLVCACYGQTSISHCETKGRRTCRRAC